MAIGPTLQEARQRKQLTTSQVAEMTRVKVQIVDDIENDDFHRIAAPIYGKGFIKLIAECLDLDPAPLIADYRRTVNSLSGDKSQAEPDTEPDRASAPASPAAESPSADLFEFASLRRRRVTPTHSPRPATDSPASPSAPAAKPGPVPARHHTRSERRTLAVAIRKFTQPLLDRGVILAGILRNRLANLKWSDRLLKPVGIVLAALVALLVLVAVIRSVVARTGSRPPEDHELLFFIPPPEPYVE